jgi:hypothetical protein
LNLRHAIATLAVLLAGSAFAQGTQNEATGFSEVERGFFLGVSGGPSFVTKAPANSGPRPFSSGQTAELELGYDLGPRLAISFFISGTMQHAGSDYIGNSGGAASGDFSFLVPGAALRLNALGFDDGQGVQRTWIYLRGGVGYAMFTPKALLPDSDFLVFAGPGLEYYTRLRHFSIGVELEGTMLAKAKTFGFQVTPTLRYAF